MLNITESTRFASVNLSLWHMRKRNVNDVWACEYVNTRSCGAHVSLTHHQIMRITILYLHTSTHTSQHYSTHRNIIYSVSHVLIPLLSLNSMVWMLIKNRLESIVIDLEVSPAVCWKHLKTWNHLKWWINKTVTSNKQLEKQILRWELCSKGHSVALTGFSLIFPFRMRIVNYHLKWQSGPTHNQFQLNIWTVNIIHGLRVFASNNNIWIQLRSIKAFKIHLKTLLISTFW